MFAFAVPAVVCILGNLEFTITQFYPLDLNLLICVVFFCIIAHLFVLFLSHFRT